MKSSTNSTLQRKILLTLANKNASSITALARDLDTKRSSVSRSVKLLIDTNLIVRQRRALSLTETGQEEARRIMTDIPIKAKKATDLAAHILGQAAESLAYTKPFDGMSYILRGAAGRQLIEAMNPSTKMLESIAGRQLIEAMNPSTKMLESIAGRQLIEAMNATARVQTINLDWLQLQHSSMSAALNHLFIKNNAIISNMIVDLGIIAEIEIVNNQAFSSLINQTAKTAKTYNAYFNSATQTFDTLPSIESLSSTIVVPTTTTASVISSARSIIESQAVSQMEESESTNIRTYSEQYIPMTSILEGYLEPLGERFLNKWEGAWHSLYSGNKDRHSQATHSARELLIQVLANLAPNEVFTKEECAKNNVDNPSRKMRIRYILRSNNKHSIALIESLADLLDETYHELTGETHRRDDGHKEDEAIAAMIAGLGNFLILLLSKRNSELS